MKHIFFHGSLFCLIFGAFSCGDPHPLNKKYLADILDPVLTYEAKEIIRFGYQSNYKHRLKPDSNIIFFNPGCTYEKNNSLFIVLDGLEDEFHELNYSKQKYIQVSERICKAKTIPFYRPKDINEFDRAAKNGKAFAIIQLYRVWVNKKGDRFAYVRLAAFQYENFLEGYQSIRFFKKEKGKWVFEKEL